jgi:hypothetical protein
MANIGGPFPTDSASSASGAEVCGLQRDSQAQDLHTFVLKERSTRGLEAGFDKGANAIIMIAGGASA